MVLKNFSSCNVWDIFHFGTHRKCGKENTGQRSLSSGRNCPSALKLSGVRGMFTPEKTGSKLGKLFFRARFECFSVFA